MHGESSNQPAPLTACLMNLYEPDNRTLNYNDLMEVATRKSIIVSEDEAIAVEMKTRDQARSRLWFRMRAGRITASKFKVACSTDPSSPSLSLVMSICYPERMRFSSDATSWGCSHETTARKSYEDNNVTENRMPISKCAIVHVGSSSVLRILS